MSGAAAAVRIAAPGRPPTSRVIVSGPVERELCRCFDLDAGTHDYTTLELRVGGFEEYLARWRAQLRPYSDEGERVLERTIRYDLARLPDGAYRRRAVRAAFEETWASLRKSDSLGALTNVPCPTLIVQATRPWPEGRPYLTDATIVAQRKAVPHAQLFVARQSDHPMLVRDPEPEMVETLRNFVLSLPK